MKIEKQYLLNRSGKDIYLFTLENEKGSRVKISNYGAIITSFNIKKSDGSMNDIVLGFDRIEDYWSPPYLRQYPWFGCAVGRNANRIKNAEFVLDGRKFKLTRNNGNHQLHGGIEGFDKKTWEHKEDNREDCLELRYLSPDGDEGFPGNLDVSLIFRFNGENELSYEFMATTDKPTPVNLTHHSYFNLDNAKGTIHEHALMIPASYFLEQVEIVATGNLLPVVGTIFDFRTFKKLSEGLKTIPGYDHSFVRDEVQIGNPAAELYSEKSGTRLRIFSTEPVVHFYSGKWTPEVIGKNGTRYGPFSGLCLETHKHPNAMNIAHFPDIILRPGQVYRHKTIYKVID